MYRAAIKMCKGFVLIFRGGRLELKCHLLLLDLTYHDLEGNQSVCVYKEAYEDKFMGCTCAHPMVNEYDFSTQYCHHQPLRKDRVQLSELHPITIKRSEGEAN